MSTLPSSLLQALQVDAAVRYEDFSDFGDTTVLQADQPVRLRRTQSRSAARRPRASGRPATLAEGFYSATNVSPTSAFVQLPPNSAAATLLGLNGLQPEESKNYSLGFLLHPDPVLSITVDAFQIEIDNRIVGSGALFGSGCARVQFA